MKYYASGWEPPAGRGWEPPAGQPVGSPMESCHIYYTVLESYITILYFLLIYIVLYCTALYYTVLYRWGQGPGGGGQGEFGKRPYCDNFVLNPFLSFTIKMVSHGFEG